MSMCARWLSLSLVVILAVFLLPQRALAIGAPSYVDVVLGDGPIAYYRLDQSGGPIAYDRSSHRVPATYASGVRYRKEGAVPTEDWSRNYGIFAPDGPAITGSARTFPRGMRPRSAEAWLLVPRGMGDEYANGIDFHGLVYEWYPGGMYFTTYGVGHIGAIFPVNLADSRWHQIAYTFNGSTLSAFVDGKLLGRNSVTSSSGFAWDSDGGLTVSSSLRLDEVSIYDRALTPAEIKEHFGAAHGVGCHKRC